MDITDVSRLDLQVLIAKLYYHDNLTQQQIADQLFISRPTVSRLIKSCVDEGVVTIKIRDASSKRETLAERIRARYGLKSVIVTQSDDNLEVSKDRVGAAAADLLATILKRGDLVGISWGTTVNRLLFHMDANVYPEANVIQILGDTQAHRESNATHMTLSLSNALGGDGYIMQAPMLVGTKLLKDLLLNEPHMVQLYQMFKKINVAILGFGGISAPNHLYLTYGKQVKSQFEKVKQDGAVCDLLGAFIDENGERVATPLDEVTFAMPLEQLRDIPLVIGMAAGIKKRKELLAVLRGNYFDTLVIDEDLALTVPL